MHVVAAHPRHATMVSVDVTLKNASPGTVRIDKAFETFLHFNIVAPGGGSIQMQDLPDTKPAQWTTADRFIELRSGEQYTRTVHLTDKVRHFVSGSALLPSGADVPIGSEVFQRAVLPANTARVVVYATYMLPEDESFRVHFGVAPSDVGLLADTLLADSVSISLSP